MKKDGEMHFLRVSGQQPLDHKYSIDIRKKLKTVDTNTEVREYMISTFGKDGNFLYPKNIL